MKDFGISNVLKWRKPMFLLAMFLIQAYIQPECVSATASNVIKVGYPSVAGFTEIEDGIYRGYAYDYLTEISKYTGWEYEFIEMSLNDMIYKLRDGDIDLAAGMLKNEQTEEMYDFPKESAGYTYTTLCALKENDLINGTDYETLNGIKVGYYEGSHVKLSGFMKFCEENEIEDVELIPYELGGSTDLLDALKAKEVDAILSGDLLLQGEEKVVCKFNPIPYYFATTKGKKEILEGLNTALSKIKENNVNFDQQLYNNHFKDRNDDSLYLTQEELEYINQLKPLKAVYLDNFAPMQDYNPETKRAEGIYIDIMELIAQKSGLRYELVKANNFEEANEMIKNNEVDVLICAPDSYLLATKYGYTLTQEYLEANMVRVFDANHQGQEDKQIIAIPRGYFYHKLEGEYDIQYYDTLEDCLEAVKKGKVTSTYGNSYVISKYLASGLYSNLSTYFEEIPVKAAIGISKPVDVTLMNIINKSVSSITEVEFKNIIYSNTLQVNGHVTLRQFFFDNLLFCCVVILLFVLLIYIIIRIKYKRLLQDRLYLLEKSQTDALTGIYNREAGEGLVTTYLQTIKPSLYSALIIMDIDYFKQVNDYLGHQIGDALLVEFSQVLKQIFSYHDIIFRLGGDEFIVFMTELESNDLQIIDSKLQETRQRMNKVLSHKGKSQTISLSIGAVVTKQDYDFCELYREADQMLYEVKRNGRNGAKVKTLS